MQTPKSTYLCPYCFTEHKKTEIQFRCSNRRCKEFDDIELTRYENGNLNNPKKGHRTFFVKVPNVFSLPNSAVCPEPDCGKVTYKVVCPSCHNPLPESTLKGTDMIISVVGSRDTGKSHFVGVIIKEMIERISVRFDGAVEGFDDTLPRYRSGFEQKLYYDLKKLDLTKSSEQDVNNGAYRPLIFTLKLKTKGFLKENIDAYTLVFFDTAGEDLNDEDTMSTVNKYICKSAGIIFLLDPLQIPAVRNKLDENDIKRASSVDSRLATRSDDIITRVSKLIRNDKRLRENERIKIPVAVVFSKYDMIESIVPPGSVISQTSPHCANKFFVLSDWHNVNMEIEGLLKIWSHDSFIQQLEINYTNFSYFAVSALGLNNNPQLDRTIEKPRPHRIEDPLLWLLKENNVVKAK